MPFDDQTPRRRPGVAGPGPGVGPLVLRPSTTPAAHGFVDARPSAGILAHPVPGYDYSRHAEAPAIRQGMNRAGSATAGHPLFGMIAATATGQFPDGRPGVQGPPPPPQPVGVPNAFAPPAGPMNLPERGKVYPASQRFDIPAHWGQGYVESNGQRAYTFTTPEEAQTERQRAADYRDQQERATRTDMLREAHENLQGVLNPYGFFGYMSPEERSQSALALMGHIQALSGQGDARHAAELQFGNDPRRDPELVRAQVAATNAEAQHHLAQAQAADPMRKLELIDAINRDPQRRSLALALGGADAQTIAAMPTLVPQGHPAEFNPGGRPGVLGSGNRLPGGVAVNAGNFDQWLAQDQNRAAAAVLADPATSFGRKFQLMAQMPGFNDPSHPTRQAWDTFARRTFPTRQRYQEYVESLPAFGPDEWRTPIPLGPLKEWVAGPILSGLGQITGQGGGYGFGWRGRNQEREDLFDTLDRTGWTY